MIRVVVFFVVVLLVAFGASWLADHPGSILVTFGGQEYQTSTLAGLVALLAAAALLLIAWTVLRFVLRVPSLLSMASTARRKQRGYAALSRGMIAVGSGDTETARRNAGDAARLLRDDPLALLLQAQSAQLSGDRDQAETTFTAMLQHPDTRTLALRGLHMEAVRRGDRVAALAHAEAAQKIATLPWAAQAVTQTRAADGDWAGALKAVERSAGARVIDRPTANRHRAVLLTGVALDEADRDPDEALRLAREALKLAPTLVPAAALAGRLLARRGDTKRGAKLIEAAYAETPHPDLADIYVHLRHGDSALDRLARAETLARCALDAPESRLTVARAALDAREFDRARTELAPLLAAGRPTRRACLLMADIEEAEHGETGALFEWLQRASRATRDPAWIADGIVSDRWRPVAPGTGRLDAFTWATPQEHLTLDHEGSSPSGETERTAPTFSPHARVSLAPVAAEDQVLREDTLLPSG